MAKICYNSVRSYTNEFNSIVDLSNELVILFSLVFLFV